ncbi:MAG: hypothetical protein J0L61_02580 [Planctomycetes bacterium]|nr:hypothetical protein [Planctomycetota bacterium]
MTLLELLLALAVTILTGAAAAAVTLAVSRGMISMNAGRSVINRANLIQARLRAVTDTARCALDAAADKGLAVWAEDPNADGRVNVLELRVVWFNADEQTLTLERVQFPKEWTQEWVDSHNLTLAAADDPFLAMQAQRALGYTTTSVLGSRVGVTAVESPEKVWKDAQRLRVNADVTDDLGSSVGLLVCLGFPSHRPPQ